ncbi:cofilin [Crucibulum laeve]|uniref:Cofilin n=1 Tax=Crucibulum laeve TaxID=68775 RepID=A0A5C3LJY8_9AGAR|nr:cofilin [Crucibulum laeve]
MSSGVPVNGDCIQSYQDLKLNTSKTEPKKYIIFNLNKDFTEIIVEKTSISTKYEDFLADLPENECRWAIYDLEFEKDGGDGKRKKIIFVSWVPDDAKIKQKMVFASSRDALKRALVGIAVEVQATDASEIAYETVLEKAKRTY